MPHLVYITYNLLPHALIFHLVRLPSITNVSHRLEHPLNTVTASSPTKSIVSLSASSGSAPRERNFRLNEQITDWMNKWMNGRMKACTHRMILSLALTMCPNEWMNEWKNECDSMGVLLSLGLYFRNIWQSSDWRTHGPMDRHRRI